MSFCNGRLQCDAPAETVEDPDMNGIGVVLSFVITAAISVIVAIMAVLKRGIPKQQYMRVDEKILHWVGVRKPASDAPSNLGYQSLLLALSDQMLAVGLCYLIAMYAQVCSVSNFSFYIGAQLAYLSSGVHLCTLLVLKSYFRKHPKQAILRGALMVLLMGLLGATFILQFLTVSEPRDMLFLCGLHYPTQPRLNYVVPRSFGIAVLLIFVYWNAFRSIRLDNSLRYTMESRASKNIILRWIYSGHQGQSDLQTFSERRQDKIRRDNRKNATILEQQDSFWKALHIVVPPVLTEIVGSVLLELLIAICTFCVALYTLVIGLFYQGVDTKPLFSATFGQILPMLLLIVIALTALEVGTIKNFRAIEIETEIKKQPASVQSPPLMEDSAALPNRGLLQRTQGKQTGIIHGDMPESCGNSLMPMASASYSQPDLSGNGGFGTRVDSMTRWMALRRTNTLEIEEGKIGD
ncbi:uncharacterized protein FIESC28_10880 [Fusarium coffeatum]|uniref:Uncharacterized protein n=1 Tax=Fusarium coffeatum TaxID=231269 RepID=A0A366QQ10_9HYPO|nr:uncharacterized protein FIESC28_10880 [Fusarium coffeatum]RBR06937.1 hypothetical protein FIESC28_10880 [Fusarium coffeatum]